MAREIMGGAGMDGYGAQCICIDEMKLKNSQVAQEGGGGRGSVVVVVEVCGGLGLHRVGGSRTPC